MNKHILYHEEARIAMMKGVKAVADTVAITLGPQSHNIILHKHNNSLHILNNGFNIIKEIELENCFENIGIKLIRQASYKTNNVVGDGTTTTTIIAHSLIYYGMTYLISGINIIGLTAGIQKAVEFLSSKLVEYARPINDLETLNQIGTIASGNPNIGAIVANIVNQIGSEGIITLEDSHSEDTTVEISQGIKIDKGFFSSAFAKKDATMKIFQDNPYILITDKKITLVKEELIPILELVNTTNRPLLILAEDLSSEVLSTLIINRMQNIINVVAIKLPGFGNQKQLFLEDISSATRSKIISDKTGFCLNSVELSMLGVAQKVIVTSNSTTIFLGNKKEYIRELCDQLRKQINISSTIYEQENLKNRLAKISCQHAIIKVGASNNNELQDNKAHFREALNSIKAAVVEGIVPGGWSVSIPLSAELLKWAKKYLSKDEMIGALLVKKSFTAPLRKIVHNAGYNEAVILHILEQHNFEIGYDATSNSYVNMYRVGIIDSAKVIRLALQNAASIAKMFLTTECVIVNRSEN